MGQPAFWILLSGLGLLACGSAGAAAAENASCRQVGSMVFCSDGSVSRQVGNTTYDNEGGAWRRTGDVVRGSDGSSYRRAGTMTFDDRGNSWRHVGDTTFGSDGSICRDTGAEIHCSGPDGSDPARLVKRGADRAD